MKVFGPFVELARVQNEVNKIFESLLEVSPEASVKAASGWLPSADVLLTDEKVTVTIDLPGINPSSVKLAVGSGQLTVSGDKPRPETVEGAKYHCLERGHGAFARTIVLPEPVNTHRANAALREGLLTVTFPRVANRRGAAIPIDIETE